MARAADGTGGPSCQAVTPKPGSQRPSLGLQGRPRDRKPDRAEFARCSDIVLVGDGAQATASGRIHRTRALSAFAVN